MSIVPVQLLAEATTSTARRQSMIPLFLMLFPYENCNMVSVEEEESKKVRAEKRGRRRGRQCQMKQLLLGWLGTYGGIGPRYLLKIQVPQFHRYLRGDGAGRAQQPTLIQLTRNAGVIQLTRKPADANTGGIQARFRCLHPPRTNKRRRSVF